MSDSKPPIIATHLPKNSGIFSMLLAAGVGGLMTAVATWWLTCNGDSVKMYFSQKSVSPITNVYTFSNVPPQMPVLGSEIEAAYHDKSIVTVFSGWQGLSNGQTVLHNVMYFTNIGTHFRRMEMPK